MYGFCFVIVCSSSHLVSVPWESWQLHDCGIPGIITYFYTPPLNSGGGEYYSFTLDVCVPVHLSVFCLLEETLMDFHQTWYQGSGYRATGAK